MWLSIKSVIQENMNIILGALILSPQKNHVVGGANLQIFGHERIWLHFHSAIMELYGIVGVTVRPRPYINTIYAIWWEEWFVRNWVSQYVINKVWEEWFDKKESRIWVMHDNNNMQFSCICGDGLDGSVRGEFWKFGDERTFGFMIINGRILYH